MKAQPFVIRQIGPDHELLFTNQKDTDAVFITAISDADTIPEPTAALRSLVQKRDRLNQMYLEHLAYWKKYWKERYQPKQETK